MYIMGNSNSCNAPPYGSECDKICTSPGTCPGFDNYKKQRAKEASKCDPKNPMTDTCEKYCEHRDGSPNVFSDICAPYQIQKQLNASNKYSNQVRAAKQQKNRSRSMTEDEKKLASLQADVIRNRLPVRGGGKGKEKRKSKKSTSSKTNTRKKLK